MTNYGKAVLWIGFALIALNLAKNWASIAATIFGKGTASSGSGSSGGVSGLSLLPFIGTLGPFLLSNQQPATPGPATQTPTTVAV